jgi:hypothetical protein
MKVKLIIKDDNGRRILQNAENTARRVEQWPAWKRNAPEEGRTNQNTTETTKNDSSD